MMKTIGIAAAGLMFVFCGAVNAQTIGVPSCDDFVTKYDTCVGTKVPSAQRPTFKAQLDQLRQSWSGLAKDASSKAALDPSCKQSAEAMKTAMQAYGCTF